MYGPNMLGTQQIFTQYSKHKFKIQCLAPESAIFPALAIICQVYVCGMHIA